MEGESYRRKAIALAFATYGVGRENAKEYDLGVFPYTDDPNELGATLASAYAPLVFRSPPVLRRLLFPTSLKSATSEVLIAFPMDDVGGGQRDTDAEG